MTRTREVFEPTRTTSFPVRDSTEGFIDVPQKEENDRDILVRITVLAEFPATADFRAARVETRTVGPPFPPVVLHYAVSGDWVGRLNGTHPPRAA